MEKDANHESPLACDLTALDAAQRERHQIVTPQMLAVVREIRELPDGYALRLPAELSAALLVTEFVARERLCCPFFTFGLEFEREGGPLWLRMTGPEGVKQFLLAELGVGDALIC